MEEKEEEKENQGKPEEISMEKILPIKPKKTVKRIKKTMSQKEVGESVWKDIDKKVKIKETAHTLGVIANEIEGERTQFNKERDEKLNEALYQENQKKKEKTEKKDVKKKVKKEKLKPEKIFFNNVKILLDNRGWEIVRIEKLNKKEIFAKVRDIAGRERPRMLAAFNKTKITEKDILTAHKNLNQFKMPYYILSKGEMPKKIEDSIEAHQRIFEIGIFQNLSPIKIEPKEDNIQDKPF